MCVELGKWGRVAVCSLKLRAQWTGHNIMGHMLCARSFREFYLQPNKRSLDFIALMRATLMNHSLSFTTDQNGEVEFAWNFPDSIKEALVFRNTNLWHKIPSVAGWWRRAFLYLDPPTHTPLWFCLNSCIFSHNIVF